MPPPFRNTDTPGDSCQLARNEILKRCREDVPCDSGGNELAHVLALMLRDGSQSREWSAVRPDNVGRISDDETLGMFRNG